MVNSLTSEPLRKTELTLSTSMSGDFDMEAAMALFSPDAANKPPAPKPAAKSFKVTTDAAGKFRFDRVAPGDYYLTAVHAGFVDGHYTPSGKDDVDGKLHLSADGELAGVLLRLVPQGVVSGRIVDEDGDPVPGATVTALTSTYASGHIRLIPLDTATANDRGEYRLGKVPAGRYYISVDAQAMDFTAFMRPTSAPPADGSRETGYVTTYFPGTTDTAVASRVEVAAGADLPGIDIHLKKAVVVRVKGQALNADGTPIKAGQIMLMSPAKIGSMKMAMLHPDGTFELTNVQPGSYSIMTVEMNGTTPSVRMRPLVVPVEGLQGVKLASLPEGTIHGKVVTAGDSQVKTSGMMVMLGPAEGAASMPAFGQTDETGSFALKVNPAPYDLNLPAIPPGAYIRSVQLSGRETLGRSVDFSAGVTGDLLITLGTDGGKVDVTVTLADGKPVAEATVVLLPADPARRYSETTKDSDADATGHVLFNDVPPGDYLAFAWEFVDSGAWLDPDFMKTAEKAGKHVAVGAKGNERVELRQIPKTQ